MSGRIMDPTNRCSSNKLKELLSACRSSFKKRKGCRREKQRDAENCTLMQKKYQDNSSSVLGSDTSASVTSTNSNSKELRASSRSSDPERTYPCSRVSETSKSPESELDVKELYVSSKTPAEKEKVKELRPPEEKPTVKQLDVPSKAAEEKAEVRQLDGYVGFANLPNQIYWKAVKKGFEFTLMVVGQSGLGKSTLINSMFLTDIYNSTDRPEPTLRCKRTVSIEATTVTLQESGVKLALTVIDTPGFGDAINNANSWTPIVKFIESKHKTYLTSETRINRGVIKDERVHCCLYFIQPTGHGLKSLDIEFMKRIHDKVNIIPVIAKADTLTEEECCLFKKKIMGEIAEHNIKIYQFPDISEEDEEYELNKSLRDKVPFAVVGSNTLIEVNGRRVRGRQYPWGVVDIENIEQCDFNALRKMVVSTHMQDLKDVTHFVHYENYRSRELLAGYDPFAQINKEKLEHELKMKKMECEMQQMFDAKVREKTQKFEQRQAELSKKYEASRRKYHQQAKDLEEKCRQFMSEKCIWESERQGIADKCQKRYLDGKQESGDDKSEDKRRNI